MFPTGEITIKQIMWQFRYGFVHKRTHQCFPLLPKKCPTCKQYNFTPFFLSFFLFLFYFFSLPLIIQVFRLHKNCGVFSSLIDTVKIEKNVYQLNDEFPSLKHVHCFVLVMRHVTMGSHSKEISYRNSVLLASWINWFQRLLGYSMTGSLGNACIVRWYFWCNCFSRFLIFIHLFIHSFNFCPWSRRIRIVRQIYLIHRWVTWSIDGSQCDYLLMHFIKDDW